MTPTAAAVASEAGIETEAAMPENQLRRDAFSHRRGRSVAPDGWYRASTGLRGAASTSIGVRPGSKSSSASPSEDVGSGDTCRRWPRAGAASAPGVRVEPRGRDALGPAPVSDPVCTCSVGVPGPAASPSGLLSSPNTPVDIDPNASELTRASSPDDSGGSGSMAPDSRFSGRSRSSPAAPASVAAAAAAGVNSSSDGRSETREGGPRRPDVRPRDGPWEREERDPVRPRVPATRGLCSKASSSFPWLVACGERAAPIQSAGWGGSPGTAAAAICSWPLSECPLWRPASGPARPRSAAPAEALPAPSESAPSDPESS